MGCCWENIGCTMVYWKFARPFTLLVPATGMIAGALMALGATPKWVSEWSSDELGIVARIVAGALLGAALNVFSNGVNQIFDLEVDRINKPERMLPSGSITKREAWAVSLAGLLVAISLGWAFNWQCFSIVLVAALLTYIYSAPPLRTKSRLLWANITIAIPRGTLLIVCGWSTVKNVWQIEPWLIGAVFGGYILGAATTKDFSDAEGDRRGGCRTLPVVFGPRKAVRIIIPFLVLPFLFLVPGALKGWLTGHHLSLMLLGLLLPLWGVYVSYLLLSDAEKLVNLSATGGRENHPSWTHMYLLTLVAQFGMAGAYLLA
jgi:4-hydroxybenzoate polyprenyltransferase